MTNTPDISVVKERLRSSVTRRYKYKQGEIIYGVREFNYHDNEGWSSSGKTFRNKERCKTYYNEDNPLRNPEIHDTIFYEGKVAMVGGGGRDTFVIDSEEETEMILTDIKVIDRKKPGESVN